MVKVTVNKKTFSMDGYLRSNCDIIKELITDKDHDCVGICDGYEGVGKSVMAMQIAGYIDPTLTLQRICFTSDEFKKAVLNGKKGQAIVYDEAITGAFSREAIQLLNVTLIKMMAQIRQKNLFILMVLPSLFDLDKNLAIWRSKFLIHCYFGKNYDRGYFRFANLDRKKSIYIEGAKLYKYPTNPIRWNFWGRFTNTYIVDEKQYRKKKAKSLIEQEYEGISLRRLRSQRDSLVCVLSNLGFTQTEISDATDHLDEGLSQRHISQILIKYQRLEMRDYSYKLKSLVEKLGGGGRGKSAQKHEALCFFQDNHHSQHYHHSLR